MSPSSSHSEPALFQLKGSMLSLTVLELTEYDLTKLETQLAAHISQAPQFFVDAPIVLNLNLLENLTPDFRLQNLITLCHNHGLQVIGVKAQQPQIQQQAKQLGVAIINQPGAEHTTETKAEPPTPIAEPEPAETSDNCRPTKLITQPIRSGQQIYAEGADLIVLAAVSAGAEILADGHIHVYGPLRGRALAGVKGDTRSMIFCQQMAAELLSIAGHYKVAEDLKNEPLWGESCSIALAENLLKIQAL